MEEPHIELSKLGRGGGGGGGALAWDNTVFIAWLRGYLKCLHALKPQVCLLLVRP